MNSAGLRERRGALRTEFRHELFHALDDLRGHQHAADSLAVVVAEEATQPLVDRGDAGRTHRAKLLDLGLGGVADDDVLRGFGIRVMAEDVGELLWDKPSASAQVRSAPNAGSSGFSENSTPSGSFSVSGSFGS
jgi:hypothetical protein